MFNKCQQIRNKMSFLMAFKCWFICFIISSDGRGLHSPFESGEIFNPSPSAFLFPRSTFGSRQSKFIFPRSIFSRRLNVENRENKVKKELTQLNKTCPKGFELKRKPNGVSFDCECKKYHLKWPKDGLCYREYEQGPCPHGHR